MQLRAEQFVEKQVAESLCWRFASQDERAAESKPRRASGSLADVIALRPAERDHMVALPVQRVG
jgi:hypothetical protein